MKDIIPRRKQLVDYRRILGYTRGLMGRPGSTPHAGILVAVLATLAAAAVSGCTANRAAFGEGDLHAAPALMAARSTTLTTASAATRLCWSRHPTIVGTKGDDHLTGTEHRDVIMALRGDDTITGVSGDDRVCAGPGDDTVRARYVSSDWLDPRVDLGPGNDIFPDGNALYVLGDRGVVKILLRNSDVGLTVEGGPGNDILGALHGAKYPHARYPEYTCVSYAHSPRPVRVDLTQGRASGQGKDRIRGMHCITGSRYGDDLIGTRTADTFNTHAGLNRVTGRGGNDGVYAGPNADVIRVGPGRDYVVAGGGWDRLYGGPDNDYLQGEGAGDHVYGGRGKDLVIGGLECDPGSSYGYGTLDDAPNQLFGGPGDDHLTGDLGNDSLYGGTGFDEGNGGYHDHRTDLLRSVERKVLC